MAITYHLKMDENENGVASTTITNHMLHMFGVSKDELHNAALENSEKMFPANIFDLHEKLRQSFIADMKLDGMPDEMIEEMLKDFPEEGEKTMTVVSNDVGINGAAVIFYPGIMDKMAEIAEGDYFILPSSVHETIILHDRGNLTTEELTMMVKEINATQVEPWDRLTDKVYHYDPIDKVFEKASAFEERLAKKAEAERNEKKQSIILFCSFGIYQFLVGKPTILSKNLLRKYNLNEHFIKIHGMLYIIVGCILLGILLFYCMSSRNIYVLYVGLIILGFFYCIELLLIIKKQGNIDKFPVGEVGKGCLLILFTILIVIYFRPFPLFDLVEHAEKIQVSIQELGTDAGGNTYIDESASVVLSSKEKEDVISVSNQYSYYRNLPSFKDDGTVNRFPNKILVLNVEENADTKAIFITSMREIIIDNHSYTMPNSWEFIDTIQSFLQ